MNEEGRSDLISPAKVRNYMSSSSYRGMNDDPFLMLWQKSSQVC